MTKRKSKKPQDDTSILLEPSVSQAESKTNANTCSPALLFVVVFTVGASVMGWFCAQQQQSLDQLSDTFTTMQNRVANLQQVVEMTDAQTDAGFGVEERMFALEEAQKQAQEKADVALATSEKLKNSDNYEQLWALHDDMDTRLTGIKQVVLSVTTLQAMFNNQSEEFEAVKESVVAGLSSSSALAESVAGLTSAVLSACSRVDEQVASVEALNAQLEGQASDLSELKELMYLHKDALHTNNQEMAAIKELVEAKQAMRAQALEEMLSSVQMTLDEQYFTSQTLRSSLMSQLQTFHSQGPAAEEFVSTTAQNAAEVTEEKLEDDEEKDEHQDTDDEAEEEAEEEEAMQEVQPLEQEVERGLIEEEEITEEEEEEITPEKKEEITPEEEEITPEKKEEIAPEEEEITPEKKEEIAPEKEEEITPEKKEEIAPEKEEEITPEKEEEITPQEKAVAETVDGHVLDQSLEEEVSEEVGETVVEDSGELNGEVFMDGNGEEV
uniref:Zgc:66479 n=1 Tax=Cyclopterus lumpus TaxID=8103 RepID=A0A8C3A3C8_CYCLU